MPSRCGSSSGVATWRTALACAGAGVVGAALSWSAGCTAFGTAEGGPDADAEISTDAPRDGTDSADAPVLDAAEAAAPGPLIAFVTRVGYTDATTTAADMKCATEATMGGRGGKFVAWLSSASEAAPARLVDSKGTPVDGPWFRVDGKRVVATRAALLNAAMVPLENAINVTATGTSVGGSAWTGTHADGTLGVLCPAVKPTTGIVGQVGAAWTDQSTFTATCGSSLLFYCFQVE